MSNPKSAEYLVDSLYGLTIETGYLMGHFHRGDRQGDSPTMKAVTRPDTGIREWMQTLVRLFDAYGLSHDTVQVQGKPVETISLIKEILEARARGDQSPEALRQTRDSVYSQAAAIRAAMLTPSAQ